LSYESMDERIRKKPNQNIEITPIKTQFDDGVPLRIEGSNSALNSVLLCLFYMPCFKNQIYAFNKESKTANTTIRELLLLFGQLQDLRGMNTSIVSNNFCETLTIDIKSENDVVQLYSTLIKWLQEIIKPLSKIYSGPENCFTPISTFRRLFNGSSGYSNTCKDQGCSISYKLEPWKFLSVSIQDKTPLNYLIQQWEKEESLPNSDCDKCNAKTTVIRKHFLDYISAVLPIRINRMAQNGEKNYSIYKFFRRANCEYPFWQISTLQIICSCIPHWCNSNWWSLRYIY